MRIIKLYRTNKMKTFFIFYTFSRTKTKNKKNYPKAQNKN